MQSDYCGAFLWRPGFLSPEEVREAAALAHRLNASRRPVMDPSARRDDLEWFGADLGPDQEISRKIAELLGAQPDLLSFYYLEPGARVHPHRDLTGASMNDRIRYHIPIATNPAVEFHIGGRRVEMRPGDLWVVDTSYTHAVANGGSETRVHVVAECAITDAVRGDLPRGLRARLHNIGFGLHLARKVAHALIVNSVTRPRYFAAQMRMGVHFIYWRLRGRPYR